MFKMSFYESDILVLILFLFGFNALIKGKIQLQLEAGKQGVNSFIENEPSSKKEFSIIGLKARAIGLFATLMGLLIHLFFKRGDILFAI